MKAIQRIRYGGLVVALSGFGITRLLVAETLEIDTALPFLIVGLVPLVVGLALTVYGVALAIGPFTTKYVNTIARWHVFGVGAMGVVFTITAVDQLLRSGTIGFGTESPLLVANVLLGGAIGGTLTGIRTGRLERQRRTIRRSANRALLVNRLLRHEVLSAVTIIGGDTDLLAETDKDRPESIGACVRSHCTGAMRFGGPLRSPCMTQGNTLPSHLWTAIDGYDVDRGFGRTCSSCNREYEPVDRLLVIAKRPSNTTEWTVSSIVCTDCDQQRLSEDERQASVDQVLVSAELAMVGMTLALDGESARLLDRSPANET